jgi:hypothetical protein
MLWAAELLVRWAGNFSPSMGGGSGDGTGAVRRRRVRRTLSSYASLWYARGGRSQRALGSAPAADLPQFQG